MMRSVLLTLPLLLVATVASAQDSQTGACGQPAVLNAGRIAIDGPPPQIIGQFVQLERGEPRYLELSVATDTDLVLRTDSGSLDPTLVLFDAAGKVVAHNDDHADSKNARIVTALAAGDYCLQVDKFGSLDQPRLSIPVAISAAPDADACMSQAGETVAIGTDTEPFVFSAPLNGGIYRLNLDIAPDVPVRVDARSMAFDTMLRIQDRLGSMIAENDDSDGGTDSKIDLPAASVQRQICVELTSLNETGNGQFAISVMARSAD